MTFISFSFLFFLIVSVFIFHFIPLRYRSGYLLILSYLFYFSWSIPYAFLMMGSTILFYFIALTIESKRSKSVKYLTVVLCMQLFILLFFKVLDSQWVQTADRLLRFFPRIHSPSLKILMPIGISYYTFKLIGYILDVYWQKVPAEKRFVDFASYISFFPQIVSGPIQRSEDFLSQIKNFHPVKESIIINGLQLLLFGFFKKIVVADRLTNYVSALPDYGPTVLGFACNYVFLFHIYADFSGITDISRGLAKLFGIQSPKNFNLPFYAPNIQEFWRRWHISLTSWLRDYLFLPLQLKMRRLKTWGLYLSLIINMSVIGLWHGLNWNFLVFALIQSTYMVISVSTMQIRNSFFKGRKGLSRIRNIIAPFITFHMVLISFIFLRFENSSHVMTIYKNTFLLIKILIKNMDSHFLPWVIKQRLGFGPHEFFILISSIVIMETIHLFQSRPMWKQIWKPSYLWARWLVYYILLFYIILFGNFESLTFIYAGF